MTPLFRLAPYLSGIVLALALGTWLALVAPRAHVAAAAPEADASALAHSWLADAFPVAQAGFAKQTIAGG